MIFNKNQSEIIMDIGRTEQLQVSARNKEREPSKLHVPLTYISFPSQLDVRRWMQPSSWGPGKLSNYITKFIAFLFSKSSITLLSNGCTMA
jgi:hypothetical protein